MKRTDKEQLVSELKEKISGATALYYTDFTGLNVKRMTELRRRLKKANVEYVVIKNTLALRAVNESGLVGERLKGPTGLVMAKDPVEAAKILTDFAKANDQRPTVKGGLFDGAVHWENQSPSGIDLRSSFSPLSIATFRSRRMRDIDFTWREHSLAILRRNDRP